MRCVNKGFDKIIICAGELRDYVIIKKRELTPSEYEEYENHETFTNIMNIAGRVQEINPTVRFDGVNIEDRPTHIVYVPYDPTIYELDKNSLFVEIEGINRNRQFKMMSCINVGEQYQYLALYCKETGFVDKEATDG